MKKYFLLALVLGLVFATPVAAQDVSQSVLSQLQEVLNNLRAQVLGLQQTAALGFGASSVAGTSNTAGCKAALLPAAGVGETVRCDGSKWVRSSNLLNSGNGIVSTSNSDPINEYVPAISGEHTAGGVAVSGKSTGANGNGVNTAFYAQVSDGGLGFFQSSPGADIAWNLFGDPLVVGTSGIVPDINTSLVAGRGIRLNAFTFPSPDKPECDSTLRGTLWFTVAESSYNPDTLEVCASSGENPGGPGGGPLEYDWRTLW